MKSNSKTGVGISGRKLTPVIVMILLVLCFAIAYFVTIVQQIQQKRDKTAEHWRQLVVLLDRNYSSIQKRWSDGAKQVALQPDVQIAHLSTSSESDSPEDWSGGTHSRDNGLQTFVRLVDEFRTTVDLAKQRANADAVEQYLSRVGTRSNFNLAPSKELSESIDRYNQSLSEERDILVSFGGKLVRVFLVIPELSNFELERTAVQ